MERPERPSRPEKRDISEMRDPKLTELRRTYRDLYLNSSDSDSDDMEVDLSNRPVPLHMRSMRLHNRPSVAVGLLASQLPDGPGPSSSSTIRTPCEFSSFMPPPFMRHSQIADSPPIVPVSPLLTGEDPCRRDCDPLFRTFRKRSLNCSVSSDALDCRSSGRDKDRGSRFRSPVHVAGSSLYSPSVDSKRFCPPPPPPPAPAPASASSTSDAIIGPSAVADTKSIVDLQLANAMSNKESRERFLPSSHIVIDSSVVPDVPDRDLLPPRTRRHVTWASSPTYVRFPEDDVISLRNVDRREVEIEPEDTSNAVPLFNYRSLDLTCSSDAPHSSSNIVGRFMGSQTFDFNTDLTHRAFNANNLSSASNNSGNNISSTSSANNSSTSIITSSANNSSTSSNTTSTTPTTTTTTTSNSHNNNNSSNNTRSSNVGNNNSSGISNTNNNHITDLSNTANTATSSTGSASNNNSGSTSSGNANDSSVPYGLCAESMSMFRRFFHSTVDLNDYNNEQRLSNSDFLRAMRLIDERPLRLLPDPNEDIWTPSPVTPGILSQSRFNSILDGFTLNSDSDTDTVLLNDHPTVVVPESDRDSDHMDIDAEGTRDRDEENEDGEQNGGHCRIGMFNEIQPISDENNENDRNVLDDVIVLSSSRASTPVALTSASGSTSNASRTSPNVSANGQPSQNRNATNNNSVPPAQPQQPHPSPEASNDANNSVANSPQLDGTEFNAKLVALLECPVCMEVIIPPIRQCKKGHPVCAVCRPKLFVCPTCRARFTETRNLLMEKVAEMMLFPCKNSVMGCPVNVSLKDKLKHEVNCGFRQYGCIEKDCEWKGFKQELVVHVGSAHPNKLLLENYSKFNIPFETDLQSSWVLSALDEVFIVTFKVLSQNLLKGCTIYLGPRDNSKSFLYKFQFYGKNKMCLSFKEPTFSLQDDKNFHCPQLFTNHFSYQFEPVQLRHRHSKVTMDSIVSIHRTKPVKV